MHIDWANFTRHRRVTAPTWYTQDWGLFAYSFKTSADLVYAEYRNTRRDAFWFPAIYLYRQWIELALKSVWFVVSQFDGGLGPVPQVHNLSKLWAPARAWFDAKGLIAVDDDFLPSAERFFAELDKIDPNGTAFRYPPVSTPHPDLINFALSDFEAAIDQVDTLFFGLFRLLNEYEEYLGSLRKVDGSCG